MFEILAGSESQVVLGGKRQALPVSKVEIWVILVSEVCICVYYKKPLFVCG